VKENPLITIITVVLNAKNTIEQTIVSVLNQTYSNIEYIIVDGASTDGTLDIIKSYDLQVKNGGFPNVSFRYISEPDKGIYDAMNKGVKCSKGEIIGIINADDWFEKDALSIIAQKFIKNSDIGIYHGLKAVWDNNVNIKIIGTDSSRLSAGMIEHPACFVKKEVYEHIGLFNCAYSIAADYDFMIRAKKQGVKFKLIPVVLSNFRLGGISTTTIAGYYEALQIRKKHNYKDKNAPFFTKITEFYTRTRYWLSRITPRF